MKQHPKRPSLSAHLTLWETPPPELRADLRLAVATSYDERFVLALKERLSFQCRSWDSERRVWWVHPLQTDALIEVCKRFFFNIFYTEGETTTNLRTGVSQTHGVLF